MAINSYFYDSVNGDRKYSASDFSRAFNIGFETGVLIRENAGGKLGFDIGGTNFTTIYEGKAMIQGHFVEVTGTEVVTVPSGSYSGQIVIQMDVDDERSAKIVLKTDRTPIQTTSFYELPLYDAVVSGGIITSVEDVRFQGGAVPNNHVHSIADVSGLQTEINKQVYWEGDANGVRAYIGKFNGTGKPVILYLTSVAPTPSSSSHRVWIQIDKF